MVLSSVFMMLIPVLARYHVTLVIVARILTGFVSVSFIICDRFKLTKHVNAKRYTAPFVDNVDLDLAESG